MEIFWRRPVRSSHRSLTARPTTASVAVLVSVIRKGVGSTGSYGPVISTSPARLSGQPAMGRMLRNAALLMGWRMADGGWRMAKGYHGPSARLRSVDVKASLRRTLTRGGTEKIHRQRRQEI